MVDNRQQLEANSELRRERKERGQSREAHLEAGRQLASEERQGRSEVNDTSASSDQEPADSDQS